MFWGYKLNKYNAFILKEKIHLTGINLTDDCKGSDIYNINRDFFLKEISLFMPIILKKT